MLRLHISAGWQTGHGDDDEIDGEVMNDKNGIMLLETVTPIVTVVGENEMHVPSTSPSPSHPNWRERNRRKKLLKAAKSRDSMASLINERRRVLQEKLDMLREKHAKEMLILEIKKDNEEEMVREKHMEEMFILKMKRENEEKMLREKHVEEMLILKMKKENEQQMLKERHAEEMLILKMKKENELLRRKALESQIEFYKTENV
ncbi:trichohyalin isoform X2 [Nilaparvata lugens]|uniref:trichohyalin isoform X2 n=1 Tax=Nilaparvata lugens TaxID=108931 RepID=UPI00193CF87C|nr:trichohyalin isoform X2 [Nilaparvata lugens]